MDNVNGFRSLGRFLYTQNPFYLLSCFLVIYGLQATPLLGDDLLSKTLSLAGGLTAYTVLMAITSLGVIRLGKVWEDGRSILLVVVISLVALSTALDELCINQWKIATLLATGGFFATIILSEAVLRGCAIRLPTWYRLSYYSLFAVFFATPVGLGYAVSERYDSVAGWGSVIFSCLVAAALLLLIPAMRGRRVMVRRNGTPWTWPLYPLSAFVVLIVLAGIRSHAIWMSFGFFGETIGFEPFLLLPIAFAILILVAETDAGRRRQTLAMGTLYAAPLMLLCGLGHNEITSLPIQRQTANVCR